MATVTADVLKSKFGFNDPNVIQGILNDPGQVARYEKEMSPATTDTTTSASGIGNSADLVAQQRAQEKALMDQYQSVISGQEALPAAYSRLTTSAGIPGLQQDIQNYKQQIYQVQDLIDRLNEDVTARTKGTFTSEAARRRQIAAEGEPLVANLGRLTTGLQPLTEQLATASGNVATELGLEQAQQQKELLPIQAQISAFSDQAAREISLYSTDQQNQLNLLTQKLKQQGDMSLAEYQSAQTLLQKEKDYEYQKKLIGDQMTASITQYRATTGKTSSNANNYLFAGGAPSYSAAAGTKAVGTDGSTYVSTNLGWVKM